MPAANALSGKTSPLAFTECDLLGASRRRVEARTRPAARRRGGGERRRALKVVGRRREVMVGGRRVKTIDVHAHCVIPEAYALLGLKVDDARARASTRSGPRRIGEMDEQGIDVEALSINPYWYRAERDVAEQVVKIQNERLAEFCAKYPDRFVAFASVALQFPDLAVQQLEHGVKKLGLRGAAVGASVAGDEFSDPKFHPFWAKAEELGVLIFIHPQSTPDLREALQGQRLAGQHDRQPARHDDRALAPDLRGDARPVPRAQDLLCPRRRLPAVVRAALRQQPARRPGHGHRREAEEEADRVPAADVLRHARVHLGGAAASGGRSRRRVSS